MTCVRKDQNLLDRPPDRYGLSSDGLVHLGDRLGAGSVFIQIAGIADHHHRADSDHYWRLPPRDLDRHC